MIYLRTELLTPEQKAKVDCLSPQGMRFDDNGVKLFAVSEDLAIIRLAKFAYGQYASAQTNRDSNGERMLKYCNLTPVQQSAWEATAKSLLVATGLMKGDKQCN